MAAELPHELLRTALLEHTLAIGRVADDEAVVARQALTGGVRLAELDVFAHPGLLCVRNGDGKAAGVDVRAENAVFPAELRRARGPAGLRPDILRNAGPALRRKFAGKARRAVYGLRLTKTGGTNSFVMLLLFLANAASGVIFYVLKKEKAWLTAAFLCWNTAALFLRCMAFLYRQRACYERSKH